MTALVFLDYDKDGHEAGAIKQASRCAVTAAGALGEVHGLAAGHGIDADRLRALPELAGELNKPQAG